MPGNYKRTSNRKRWSEEDMAQAIEAVKKNRMGWLLASKRFNVPQATLRRHYYSKPENLGRFKPTFNADLEKALVDHVLEFETRLFGFNTTEMRKLAFEFAEKLGLEHRFDKDKKIAGWDWLKGFRERNPNISLRAPEPTSAARARAFNKPQVMKFFSLLEKTVTENGIEPHRMYNMDESGLNTVQKPPKVFATKGRKQVGAVTSAERGDHFTVVCCGNAIGNFVPPALIIPRKNHKAEYFDGAPTGTLQLCYPSGYMVGELFFKWMRHFVSFVQASVTNKVLLILDGHSSHKNLEALEFAKANGVILLCLPPHCTHRMQPTDVSFFGPLQAYYDREMSTWMRNHPGRTITLYQVAQFFGKAYESAASVRNIKSGFEKSGIYPYNPHIFPDYMYLPSDVTENELNNEESDSSESTDVGEATAVLGEQIDFDTDATSQEVQSRHSSPTILTANAVAQLSPYDDMSQNVNSLLSLKALTLNVVTHLQNTAVTGPRPLYPDPDATFSKTICPANEVPPLTTNVVAHLEQNAAAATGPQALLPDTDATFPKTICPANKELPLTTNVVAHLELNATATTGSRPLLPDTDATFCNTICPANEEPPLSLGSNQILTGESLLRKDILNTTKSILKEISPLPKAVTTGKARISKKVGESQVLTASPYISDIKAAVQEKKEKENRKSLKQQKTVKRVIFKDDGVESVPTKKCRPKPAKKCRPKPRQQEKTVILDEDDAPETGTKRRSTRRKQKKAIILDDDEDAEPPFASVDEDPDDPACIYCNELFSQSRPKEHWVKCQLCASWCHTLCAGIPVKKKQFICELCAEK